MHTHIHAYIHSEFRIAYGMRVADPTSSTEPILSKVSPEAAYAMQASKQPAAVRCERKHPHASTNRS